MPSLPNTPHLTLGGIVSNAAHGTNKDYGTICSFVTAMEFMICTGEVKIIIIYYLQRFSLTFFILDYFIVSTSPLFHQCCNIHRF
jgi:hypothetical protein